MATALGKTRCVICGKEKAATFKCGGCLQEFCYNHLGDHRQELNKQLDEIEVNRDFFRQSLTQQIEQPNNHILIQQINQWEQKSIKKIKQAAEEARQILIRNTNEYIHQIEIRLNELTGQLRESRHEDDFTERNLRQFQEELDKLTKELDRPSIREDSASFISKIYVHVSSKDITSVPNELTLKLNVHHNTMWSQNGITIAGGNGRGNKLNQFYGAVSVYVDEDQNMYVADYNNDRIVEWKCGATNGQVVAGGNGRGNGRNQLYRPTDVIVDKERNNLIICDCFNKRVVRWARQNGTSGQTIISNIDCGGITIDNNGYLYVSDREKNEVRRWRIGDTNGTLVAGGNGSGNDLNQLSWPNSVFVDEDHSIYVADSCNNRVMKWMKSAKEGIVVVGGRGRGNGLAQLSDPQGINIDCLGIVYVADRHNHRIMSWSVGATQGHVIVGGNGQGKEVNQLDNPINLSFDREGNLYVVDFENDRVQRFGIHRN